MFDVRGLRFDLRKPTREGEKEELRNTKCGGASKVIGDPPTRETSSYAKASAGQDGE